MSDFKIHQVSSVVTEYSADICSLLIRIVHHYFFNKFRTECILSDTILSL